MNKVAFILLPNNFKVAEKQIDKIVNIMPEIDVLYEIICVLPEMSQQEFNDLFTIASSINLKFIETPDTTTVQKMNIARQLIAQDTEYLFFVGDEKKLTKELISLRIRPYEIERSIGIIGKGGDKVSQEVENSIFDRLVKFIHINPKDFKDKCCRPDGTICWANIDNMSTTVYLWDLLGGLSNKIEHSVIEYCVRAEALGYGILIPKVN